MVVSVALLSATLALGGFQAAGLGSNHQDIAPRYSGILFGITNASASIAGCVGIMGTGAAAIPPVCCPASSSCTPLAAAATVSDNVGERRVANFLALIVLLVRRVVTGRNPLVVFGVRHRRRHLQLWLRRLRGLGLSQEAVRLSAAAPVLTCNTAASP